MSTRGFVPTFVSVGTLAAASGVFVEFQNEHGFGGGNAALLGFLLTSAGLLLAGIGVGTWARCASPRKIVLSALCMGIAALALAKYGQINSKSNDISGL